MRWKGKDIETYGEIMDYGIDQCHTKEEAAEFLALYRLETEHADDNIGYISGYYGPERMHEVQELFNLTHPVFGDKTPSADEAFKAGKNQMILDGQKLIEKQTSFMQITYDYTLRDEATEKPIGLHYKGLDSFGTTYELALEVTNPKLLELWQRQAHPHTNTWIYVMDIVLE